MACCLGSHPRYNVRVEPTPGKRFALLTALGCPRFGVWLRWDTRPWGRHPCGQRGTVQAVTPGVSQPRGGQGIALHSLPWPAQKTAFSHTSIRGVPSFIPASHPTHSCFLTHAYIHLKASPGKIFSLQPDPALRVETWGDSPCFATKALQLSPFIK